MVRKLILVPFIVLVLVVNVTAQSYRVATYNLRYDNPDDFGNLWPQRLPVIANQIKFHDFDIFGTQEAMAHQLQGLEKDLPGYTYIGVGRDDGKTKGEYSAIFYKKSKFELLKKGDFWLSPITDRPNKGWDAALPRICSWGQFKEAKSDFTFYLFNVHFDHKGKTAQIESAKLLVQMAKKIAGNAPVVLTGDFNVEQNHEAYNILQNSGLFQDAYELAPIKYAPNATFNGFKVGPNSLDRIDYIFVTPAFNVKRYGILSDHYQGKTPSDHYPVLIEILYKK